MYSYQEIAEILFLYGQKYVSYGLKVYYISYGIYEEICHISNITLDKDSLVVLAQNCTKGQLYPIHIQDVIEDFLS